ncbi:MAG: elongation factor Ts [Spirochaetes bacterium]|nr:MAG: elongation factor Ts [Spirochaetota bacterium]
MKVAISAQVVKELREKTGAGFMDCKKALEKTNGDFEEAIKYLKEKGLADAQKRSGREAKEGLIAIRTSKDQNEILMVEINCETDFVSRTEKFKSFVEEAASTILEKGIASIDEIDSEIDTKVKEAAGSFGENVVIKRIVRFKKSDPEKSYFQSYIHLNGKVGVIVEIIVDPSEIKDNEKFLDFAKDVSLQIASMNPVSISRNDIPEDILKEQKEIFAKQAKDSGKPDKIIDKIVEGRLNKFFAENCLLEQKYVKDSNITIQEYKERVEKDLNCKIEIKRFARFKLGED